MRKYSSENNHKFTELLFDKINAYGIENITMNYDREFTAIIEAIEYETDEKINIGNLFSEGELNARLIVSKKLNIPFYLILFQNNNFFIYQYIQTENMNEFILKNTFNELNFVSWWASIKGTKQTHKLNNGAQFRVNDTIFHKVLKKYDLKWGGNIDGVVVKDNEIICVIDNISIAFVPINNHRADPSLFFFKRGPRYETWLSTVKLSIQLQVPHLLLTFDKNNENVEVAGITAIDYLSSNGIFYVNNIKPYDNIIRGLNNIEIEIKDKIANSKVPRII